MESLPENSRIRELYPADIFPGGNYATLPYGRTRYWLFGPEDGIKVVLVHGLTIPAITWRDVAPVLASRGFRVLAYDLYGKGYSEAPNLPYNANLFTIQLALLMQYVRWDAATIVGFSMGGGVTAAFASSFPHLCEKLVFIASSGVPPREDTLKTSPTSKPVNPIPSMTELRELQSQALLGYSDAIASIRDVGPLGGLSTAFEWIGKHDPAFKTLIIHGTEDAIVPVEHGEKVKTMIPHAQFVPVQGAAHDLLVDPTYVESVVECLVNFLKM